MKNILVFCNTYYQLLVAIQMKLTIKKNDLVSIILTDESRGAQEVAARVKNISLFQNVFFVKTKVSLSQVTVKYKLSSLRKGVFGWLPEDMPEDYSCDELVGFNFDLTTHWIYAALQTRNSSIRCNMMEEGLLSYNTPADGCKLMRTIQFIRKVFRKPILREQLTNFYCFNPSFYHANLTPIMIPKIKCDDKALQGILSDVFLGNTVLKSYEQKFIFLPCIYDFEGGEPIGELEFAKVLAKQIGRDNLIVKVHPRDDVSRYLSAGLIVDSNSSVPFEALFLLQNLSEKVLITTLSGSLLNVSAFLDTSFTGYYAYPLCSLECNSMAKHFRDVIVRYIDPLTGLKFSNVRLLTDLNQLK